MCDIPFLLLLLFTNITVQRIGTSLVLNIWVPRELSFEIIGSKRLILKTASISFIYFKNQKSVTSNIGSPVRRLREANSRIIVPAQAVQVSFS